MNMMLRAFGHAVFDCFRPKIIGITLLPLGLMLVLALLLGYFLGSPAVSAVSEWLDSSAGWTLVGNGLAQIGIPNATAIVAPLLVFLVSSSLAALLALILVAILVTPLMVEQVKTRRFHQLQALGKDSLIRSIAWSFVSTCIALAALLVTLPLWLIFPLAFVIPPLIWGWLAYRMFSFDALAKYASAAERKKLLAQNRWPLMVMGIICGYLGAAPSIIWASGVVFAFAFPLLIPLGIWIYTVVFVLSALWFVHYLLGVLQVTRLSDASQSEGLEPQEAQAAAASSAPIALPAADQAAVETKTQG